MNPRLRLVLKYAGYATYAFVVCLVTIYVFFPYDRLKKFVAQTLDSNGQYDVAIEDVGPAFPLGLTVTGIKIVSPPEKPKEKPGVVFIDRLVLRVSPFSLLSSTKDISVEIDALDGHIEADVEAKGKARKYKVKFEGLSMKKLPGIAKAISLPMTGALQGKGEIDIPEAGLRRADGKFTLKCKGCTLGDGKTKVKIDFRPKHLRKKRFNPVAEQGVTLPKVRLGSFGGDIEIDKGKAMFRQFEALSKDGEAVLLGTITLRDPFPFSNVDAYFKFKFDDELKQKEPKWKAIETSLSRGKRSDRYIGFSIRGRLKDPPRFRPARYSAVERLYKDNPRDRGRKHHGRSLGSRSSRRNRNRDRKRIGNRKRHPSPIRRPGRFDRPMIPRRDRGGKVVR